MIVVDTSGLFAALVDTEIHHSHCRAMLEREAQPFLLSPFVLCELDYLLAARTDLETELGLLAQVVSGAYQLVPFATNDVEAAHSLIDRYADLGIGLGDASVVVLAERYGTDRVLTLDERHFRALRTSAGRPFTILPADA